MRRVSIVFVLVALTGTASAAPRAESERREPSPTETEARAERQPAFFRLVGRDFRTAFTSEENWALLEIGVGAALAARSVDAAIYDSGLNAEVHGGGTVDAIFESGEALGASWAQLGGAFAAWGLGRWKGRPGVAELGRDLVRAQLLDQALTQALKYSIRRPRPDGSNRRSFPSGHASASFATATVLQRRYGWKVGVPAYSVAAYIATSRLAENRHFLSDVVFGAAVGILAGRTVTVGTGRARFALEPMVHPSGVGVQLRLQPSP